MKIKVNGIKKKIPKDYDSILYKKNIGCKDIDCYTVNDCFKCCFEHLGDGQVFPEDFVERVQVKILHKKYTKEDVK